MFPLRRRAWETSLLLLAWLALVSRMGGYALNGNVWPNGTTIAMQLSLGPVPPGTVLLDGSVTWNASAANALNIWNQYIALVKFGWVGSSMIVPQELDGKNSVFFSNAIYGQAFGANTLAVTVHFNNSSNFFTETDTVFSRSWRWNSYRGPLRFDSFQRLIPDLHRIALHEFGHTLGLAHPDEAGQTVTAIMNSHTSNVDGLTADDIAGALYLYGALKSIAPVTALVGTGFTYQPQPRFSTTSYSASNLPPGLVINQATGLISGVPTLSGDYSVSITLSNGYSSSTSTVLIHIVPHQFGRLMVSLESSPIERLLADSVRPRVYGSMPQSGQIAVVDLSSLGITKLIPVGGRPIGMCFSRDRSKLYVANTIRRLAG